MKRKDFWILTVLLALAAVLWLIMARHSRQADEKSLHAGPTLEAIQQLAELVTQRVVINDVAEARITGKTGGVRALLIVHGDLLMTVDLQQARIVSRNDVAKQMVVELPLPTARSPRVDHTLTRIYQIDRSGLWRLAPNNLAQAAVADRAYRDAQSEIAEAGDNTVLMAQSQARARQVIKDFGTELGWQIEVRWRKP